MWYLIAIVVGIVVLYKLTPFIMMFLSLFGWNMIDSGKKKKEK